MDYDPERAEDLVLALMYLTLHDEVRTWKSFDGDVMDRLHEKGFISDPKSRASQSSRWAPSKQDVCIFDRQ